MTTAEAARTPGTALYAMLDRCRANRASMTEFVEVLVSQGMSREDAWAECMRWVSPDTRVKGDLSRTV